jgi:hypothetical protein
LTVQIAAEPGNLAGKEQKLFVESDEKQQKAENAWITLKTYFSQIVMVIYRVNDSKK